MNASKVSFHSILFLLVIIFFNFSCGNQGEQSQNQDSVKVQAKKNMDSVQISVHMEHAENYYQNKR